MTVGWRTVKLAIRREVWDASLRDWVLARDPASVSDVEREANALVRELKLSDFDDDAHADAKRERPARPGRSPSPRGRR